MPFPYISMLSGITSASSYRAVASGPAGLALARPLFALGIYSPKIKVEQFAHTSRLWGV